MSKIKSAFQSGKAFIPFVTCGDPSLEVTEEIVYAMADAGADLIELGIPFSDPTAEGPVIQEANVRALSAGTTTDKIFDMVRRIRQKTDIPMVFMTYANVVYSYGSERFIRTAAEIGMDGLILPDVPFEEKTEFDPLCRQYGLDLVSLIAPTSHDRIRMIAKEASGFVYCVSSLRRYRRALEHHNRYRCNGEAGQGDAGHPVRGRLRHFHARAGRKDGRPVRRRDRLGNRQNLCKVRQGLRAAR